NTPGLRTGVDAVHYRVTLVGIQRGGRVHQAVDVRHAVARLHPDRSGGLPTHGLQPAHVRALECLEQLAVDVAQHRDGGRVRGGVGVHEVARVWRQHDVVV